MINNLYRRYRQTSSQHIRTWIEGFMNQIPCTECEGARLRKTSLGVKVNGLSIAEVNANVATLIGSNVYGDAGAVAPFAELTLTNTTSGATGTGTADSDGSFTMGVLSQSGDSMTLTATDGTSDSFTIP